MKLLIPVTNTNTNYYSSCGVNKNKIQNQNTIPDITYIYPNLDDLTSDAIFEINETNKIFRR